MNKARHRWRESRMNKNVIAQRSNRHQEAKESSPGSADQLGQSTAFKKEQVDAGRGYNPTKYGNEVALNSKSAPGTRAERYTAADRKARTAQSIPATLHQPKIFSALSGLRNQKAER